MAKGWTDERRARQSAAIHMWRPWEHSTGARSAEGKAKSARNAFRFTIRKARKFAYYLSRQWRRMNAGLPYASIVEMTARAKLYGVEVD